jgi:putative cell wall-binding protein
VMNLATEATGGPAPGVRVTFDDLTGGVYYSSLTDAFGHYAYAGNNPGPFRFGAGGGTSDIAERLWTTAWGARVLTASAPSTQTLTLRVRHKPAVYHDIVRLSGADRYKTSLAMAIEQDPGWALVQDVVIASGEDAGMVDALSAAGLAGVYTECPLLLVRQGSIPPDTVKALQAMPLIRVHVVGGTGAVSEAVYHQIQAFPNVGMARIERVAGTNRYSTAAEVAKAMKAKLGGAMPTGGLIANGEPGRDPWDALAFSPVSQKNHFPVYLVTRDSVPASTSAAIAAVGSTALYIGGGTGVVSDPVATALGVAPWNRLSGATRYDTAKAIGDRAVAAAWLGKTRIGVASTLPDALSGGTMMGRKNGPLLLTSSSSTPLATRQFFTSALGGFENGFALGGTGAVSESQRLSIQTLMNP